jgi:hypothetical protein
MSALTPTRLHYFIEALRARPELTVRPAIFAAVTGGLVGGAVDAVDAYQRRAAERSEDLAHDWTQTLKRVGSGAALGAGLGLAYGASRTHQFGKQQQFVDSLISPGRTAVLSQALDNRGKDWLSDVYGDRPSTAQDHAEISKLFHQPIKFFGHSPDYQQKKTPRIEQVGPRSFLFEYVGDIRDWTCCDHERPVWGE